MVSKVYLQSAVTKSNLTRNKSLEVDDQAFLFLHLTYKFEVNVYNTHSTGKGIIKALLNSFGNGQTLRTGPILAYNLSKKFQIILTPRV